MAELHFGAKGLMCPHRIVDRKTSLEDVLDRWTTLNLSHPAVVLSPENEEHVIAAIAFARQNGLHVVVKGGGHGTFVQINSRSAYLELKAFKTVHLDQNAGVVSVGAGVLTGELLTSLAAEGYYTTVPNSNAVGVVGCVLGGGSTSQNGLHGYMVDNVVSFTMITATGDKIEVSASSTCDQLALYHALCGAGHSLGVITNVKMRAYKISALNLSEGKLWTRTMVFSPNDLDDAVRVFSKLQPRDGRLIAVMVFLRGPPGTSAAGKPIILLSTTFYGPSEEGEKMVPELYDVELTSKVIRADSSLVRISDMNNALEPLNAHGGYKSVSSSRLKSFAPEDLKEAFNLWLKFSDDHPDTLRTGMTFSNFHTSVLEKNGTRQEHANKFLEARDRGSNAMLVPWCDDLVSARKIPEFENQFLDIFRRGAREEARTMPNNLRFDGGWDDLFTSNRMEELGRLKDLFDPDALFWSPYKYIKSAA